MQLVLKLLQLYVVGKVAVMYGGVDEENDPPTYARTGWFSMACETSMDCTKDG
jgi:hypothetical protein